jgi:hypothetical protein
MAPAGRGVNDRRLRGKDPAAARPAPTGQAAKALNLMLGGPAAGVFSLEQFGPRPGGEIISGGGRTMRAHITRVLAGGIWLLTLAPLAIADERAADRKEPATDPAATYRLSGPYAHGNLAIFLVHGKDTLAGKSFLTLQEALEQKKLVVHETQNVSQLAVENVSDAEVFIQSGDIVKGGQQDRVIATDMIVPARGKTPVKIPVPSFCVEAGRWRQRGQEAVARFEASTQQAAGKDLKLAVVRERDQRRVWMEVAKAQDKLEKNLNKSVKSEASPSSLQLTLEDKKLIETVEQYVKELTRSIEGTDDVIGFACAVNGQVVSADVYGSAALFRKLWPKLLRASAVEAVAELKKDKKFDPADVNVVKAFFADAERGKKVERKTGEAQVESLQAQRRATQSQAGSAPAVRQRAEVVTRETEKNVLVESRDRERGAAVHRSYVAK